MLFSNPEKMFTVEGKLSGLRTVIQEFRKGMPMLMSTLKYLYICI